MLKPVSYGGKKEDYIMDMEEALRNLIQIKGDALHLKADLPLMIRQNRDLLPFDENSLSAEKVKEMIFSILSGNQIIKLQEEKELDFSYEVSGLARFRGNIFFQRGLIGGTFRIIPFEIPTLDSLFMPDIMKKLAGRNQGLIIITGPTGSGKSTTLAAMVDEINSTARKHIITIEDPIEFIHKDKLCVVNQREVGSDTLSFTEALRRTLRQDPDVILVGEMRDTETMSIAMAAAETGHLVLTTLHTNDAKKSIERIVNSFTAEEQDQIRFQLSISLTAVISQRLVNRCDCPKRMAAQEIMINSPTISKLLEEGTIGKIDKVIEESSEYYHMQTLNQCLFNLWDKKIIEEHEALAVSTNPRDLSLKIRSETYGEKRNLQGGNQHERT